MAIIGIQLNRENPVFTAQDFVVWMPQFSNYIETQAGTALFNKLYTICNNKIFHSIFGSDWELAMSYAIAHYMTLIGQQQVAPSGNTLAEVAGGGVTRGVLSSMSIGDFSKTYDIDKTMVSSDDAMFWNQTSYGSALMTLYKTKAVPSIFVVTSNPVPGAN